MLVTGHKTENDNTSLPSNPTASIGSCWRTTRCKPATELIGSKASARVQSPIRQGKGTTRTKGSFPSPYKMEIHKKNVVWEKELNIPLSAIDGAARLSSVVGPLGAVTGSQSGSAGVGGARAGIARRVVGRHRVESGSH